MDPKIGGSTQKEKVEKVIVASGNNEFKCVVEFNCRYIQHGNVINYGNFLRHVKCQHPQKLEAIGLPPTPTKITKADESNTPPAKKTKKAEKVPVNRETAILGIMQLATVNSLPINFPEWIGFQTLVKPLWDSLNMNVYPKKLSEILSQAAALARQEISSEIQGKMINIKMDSASRRNHHSLGVTAQYYLNGKIVCRCLVVKEMIGSQTSAKLQDTIEQEVLKVYNVNSDQIYTITTDNGQNMVATVTNMRDSNIENRESQLFLREEYAAIDAVYQSTETYRRINLADTDEALNDLDDEQDEVSICEEFEEEPIDAESDHENETQDELEELTLGGTRCAAHTCQLAVWDVLKKHTKRIKGIKKLVKMTRQSRYKETFIEHKAHFAPISNATRWNAVYLMLKSLREQKPFYLALENKFSEMVFSKHWTYIDKFCAALEPLFFLTISLQRDHVPLSEFYTQWLVCQARLNAIKENTMATKLLSAMEKRLKNLVNTMQFKSSLYMDPRYNYIGSNRISVSDKDAVQHHLLKLWHRLDALEGSGGYPVENHEIEDDELEDYLNTYFQKDSSNNDIPIEKTENEKIYQLIKELEFRPKVPISVPKCFKLQSASQSASSEPSTSSSNDENPKTSKKEAFDVLNYWLVEQVRNPQMFRLASIVLSAPSTQVSVERAFSALKLILTDHRQRLSDDRIQDIMVLKLNPDLLPEIAKLLDASIDFKPV